MHSLFILAYFLTVRLNTFCIIIGNLPLEVKIGASDNNCGHILPSCWKTRVMSVVLDSFQSVFCPLEEQVKQENNAEEREA